MKEIEYQRHQVMGNSVTVGFEIERLVSEGWEIDPNDPLTLSGFYGNLQCGFIRDPANAKDAPPKKSRAEILADARAAKAAKKAADNPENKEESKDE